MKTLLLFGAKTLFKFGAGLAVMHGLLTATASHWLTGLLSLAVGVWMDWKGMGMRPKPNPVTAASPGARRNLALNLFSFALFCFLASLLCGGCVSAINSGHVVSVTERIFGIRIAQAVANQTPEISLGFSSSTVLLEPVLTNCVAVVPNIANTFALDQSANPFVFGVNETFASGDYWTGDPLAGTNSTGVASMPIVPSAVNTNYSALKSALASALANTNSPSK